MFDKVRTVVINYQTPDLIKIAVESLRKFYPSVKLLIIDNGSKDESKAVIERLKGECPDETDLLFLNKNCFHGPAMDKALKTVYEEYVFFLDSDAEVKRGGFLEAMLDEMEKDKNAYGIGRMQIVNKRGFPAEEGITVLVPAYMMIRRSYYSDLPPFEHHGMPVLNNFISANEKGLRLISFPIEQYIDHKWRGTASRYGYGLGLKGKIDYVLNKIGL